MCRKSGSLFAGCILSLLLPDYASSAGNKPSVSDAQTFIDKTEAEMLDLINDTQRVGWVQQTYITRDTDILAAKAYERLTADLTERVKASKQFDALELPRDLRRKFTLLKLSLVMPAPSDAKLRSELTSIATSLGSTYASGKYCPETGDSKCIGIDELEARIAKSRDSKELERMWVGWHRVGAPMRERYARFVELSNQGARELGFADTGSMWRSNYDMTPDQLSADLERLWQQVKPLYLELHAYVRRRLIAQYGTAAERPDGMIPADLLGNMWAQAWGNIYDIVAPKSAPPTYDIEKALQAKNIDAKGLVRYGENFFKSLGFNPLPETFWQRSMFTRPQDRDVMCHASAWDVDSDMDVRLKACLHGTADDFTTVHHELGHNYYSLAYRTQPLFFRGAANDGFHEAIGDSIALSITPEYLKKIGLIQEIPPPEADIPLLLQTALDRIAFLPFGLLIDKWRWEVFSGQVKPADYNKEWWRLRREYQGIAPPVERTEADFDPGAKYHIPANTPYVRYFLAAVYQFQFYRSMCEVSGYKGPLNRCSFYESKEAGAKLNSMLQLGQSKPWPEAMKVISGESEANASAILEYFHPLIEWLKHQNRGETLGWKAGANPLSAR